MNIKAFFLLSALFLGSFSIAEAETYPPAVKQRYVSACVQKCQAERGKVASEAANCQQICQCQINTLERDMSMTEFTSVYTGLVSGQKNRAYQKFEDIIKSCISPAEKNVEAQIMIPDQSSEFQSVPRQKRVTREATKAKEKPVKPQKSYKLRFHKKEEEN